MRFEQRQRVSSFPVPAPGKITADLMTDDNLIS